ncbi:hypothetical protein BJ508DRAFT_358496 [Ascobolus immersus RN42]|uniref:Uncharacterized protein n=1 Tax=Ascobolus immersus RN42 TaxID=1160509 RepID=A0A3N4IIG4_ASCIM|nr:hypothetical protein BJ508DRAFT_358496 [Ascobolus immersus RN42]
MEAFEGMTPAEIRELRFTIADPNTTLGLGRIIGLGEPTPGHQITLPGRTQSFTVGLDETLTTTLVRRRFFENYVQGKAHRLHPNLIYRYPEAPNYSTAPFAEDSASRLVASYEFPAKNNFGLRDFLQLGYKVLGVAPIPICFPSDGPGGSNVLVQALIVDELYPKNPKWFSHLEMVIGRDFYHSSPLLFRPSTLRQRFELEKYGMPRIDIFPKHPCTFRLRDRALVLDIAAYTEEWGSGEKREGRAGYGIVFRQGSGYNRAYGPEFVVDTARKLCKQFAIDWVPSREDKLVEETLRKAEEEAANPTQGMKVDDDKTPKSLPAPPTDPQRADLLLAIQAINLAIILRRTSGIYFDRIVLRTSSRWVCHMTNETIFALEKKGWRHRGKDHHDISLLRLLLVQMRSITTSFVLTPPTLLAESKALAEQGSRGQHELPHKPTIVELDDSDSLDIYSDEALEAYEEALLKDKRLDEDKPELQRELVPVNANAYWMQCVGGVKWVRVCPHEHREEVEPEEGQVEVASREWPWSYVIEE